MKLMTGFSYCCCALLLWQSSLSQALELSAQALFKNAVYLKIDGRQQMLKVGESTPEGITLIEANPKQAVIEINGKRETLGLSQHISGQYNQVVKKEVAISRNQVNQYITSALIDGSRTLVLVDTGANTVAMSSKHAKSLGINYSKGRPGRVRTASGEASSYLVKLRSVDVGGVRVDSVDAHVIDGNYPDTILLGMTYLEHVSMREQNGVLYLQAKF